MLPKTTKSIKGKNNRKGKALKLTSAIVTSTINDYIVKCSNEKGELIKEPLLIEVALLLDIDPSTLYEYSKRPDYAGAIKRIKTLGEMFLNRTMEGDKANQNAMFKLKTRHGYIEQQRLDVTTNGAPLGVIQLPSRG